MAESDFREGALVAPPIFQRLRNLGYFLLPRTHEHSPGHSGLLVLLQDNPAPGVAFVPHSMHACVVGHDGAVHWTSFEPTTTVTSVRDVAPGKVILRDRDNQDVEFFVFGAALTAEAAHEGTIYSLHSRAPVLATNRTHHSVATHLAVEVEVLLAEQRARLYAAEESLLQCLVQIDPFLLYETCLQAILTRYEQVPPLRHQYPDFFHALQVEKEWLIATGQWPHTVGELSELLKLPR